MGDCLIVRVSAHIDERRRRERLNVGRVLALVDPLVMPVKRQEGH
jgi:hypothetical protein